MSEISKKELNARIDSVRSLRFNAWRELCGMHDNEIDNDDVYRLCETILECRAALNDLYKVELRFRITPNISVE